jgi:hypothetical protein
MKIIKFLGAIVLVIVIAVTVVLIGARFADGPLGLIAGGAFSSGEAYTGEEPDWTFARDFETVEFQLLDPNRSRTTWLAVHEGRIYIPSRYMTTSWGKLWKQWPIEAEKDPRAIARIDGKLYDRTLVRVQEGDELDPILAELSRKYSAGNPVGREAVISRDLWIFEMAPRN